VARACSGPVTWSKRAPEVTLEVAILPLTGHSGSARWMLRFEERADSPRVPQSWRQRLTKREQEVAVGVLHGWDNRFIASELGCSEATVKKHLHSVFSKLGLESRASLIARAARPG